MTAALLDPRFDTAPPPRLAVVAAPDGARGLDPDVYRRRRLAVLAAVVGLVVGLASHGARAETAPAAPRAVTEAAVVVVQPGDTLWGIAESLRPGADPRPLVAALRDLAEPSTLQPGDELVIPGHLLD